MQTLVVKLGKQIFVDNLSKNFDYLANLFLRDFMKLIKSYLYDYLKWHHKQVFLQVFRYIHLFIYSDLKVYLVIL